MDPAGKPASAFAGEWTGEIEKFLESRQLRYAVLFGTENDIACVQSLTALYRCDCVRSSLL